MTLTIWAPDGVPEVTAGASLADLLAEVAGLADGDIVAVTSKVVSKAEGRIVEGDREEWLAAETERVVARRGTTTIVRNRLGLTMAAAGIDASNVEPGRLVLLPIDPDASAGRLRADLYAATGCNVAVVVTDTAGRAWRVGQTDIAIGAAGLPVSIDLEGRIDPYGNPLSVTQPAVADEIAGAAELAQGKLTSRPFAIVRGRADLVLPVGDDGPGAATLVRPEGGDLFGYGAREAVVQAALGEASALLPFGEAVSREELEAVLARVPQAGPEAVAAIAFAHGWSRSDLDSHGLARKRPVVP